MATTRSPYRGSFVGFALAAVFALVAYTFSPGVANAGPYPGPDALPTVPTYYNHIGLVPDGSQSSVAYVCGFDFPNSFHHSPATATALIGTQVVARPVIDSNGCIAIVVSVYSARTDNTINHLTTTVWVSINGGPRFQVPRGTVFLKVLGTKSNRDGSNPHTVGAYLPFQTEPRSGCGSCTTTTTSGGTTTSITVPPTTIPGTTTPNTAPPTTIPGQVTTTALSWPGDTLPFATPTTFPGETSTIYMAGSTTTIPLPVTFSPLTVHRTVTSMAILAAVVSAVSAAASLSATAIQHATMRPPTPGRPSTPRGPSGSPSSTDPNREERRRD